MKTIGFIGAYDKTDLIMNIAKTLIELERRVLIIDTTLLEKSKYVVPSISPTKSYITNFEKIDMAIGFENIEGIYKYLSIDLEKEIPYDYVLIDIDNAEKFTTFNLETAIKNYFVTGFDMYSLKRGVEILENIQKPISFTKVLYAYEILKSDEEYLNYLSLDYKTTWNNYVIYFNILSEDNKTIAENQRVSQIRLKKLSNDYRESLAIIVQDIIQDININKIRKIIKG